MMDIVVLSICCTLDITCHIPIPISSLYLYIWSGFPSSDLISKKLRIFQRYKSAQKEAKKALDEANFKAYDDIYYTLGTRGGEIDVYQVAKGRGNIKT